MNASVYWEEPVLQSSKKIHKDTICRIQITQNSSFFKGLGILFRPDINISRLCADTCHKFVCENNVTAHPIMVN
jgi:hypothetical protein